jgi:hypothetical protein
MLSWHVEYNRAVSGTMPRMHFDAHQPVIDDLKARILTIRDSL